MEEPDQEVNIGASENENACQRIFHKKLIGLPCETESVANAEMQDVVINLLAGNSPVN